MKQESFLTSPEVIVGICMMVALGLLASTLGATLSQAITIAGSGTAIAFSLYTLLLRVTR